MIEKIEVLQEVVSLEVFKETKEGDQTQFIQNKNKKKTKIKNSIKRKISKYPWHICFFWLGFIFFSVIVISDATLFCGHFNSTSFSDSNAIILPINHLWVCGTFPLLVCTLINLGHRIIYANRHAVNTSINLFEQNNCTTTLNFLFLSQSYHTYNVPKCIYIHFFLILS